MIDIVSIDCWFVLGVSFIEKSDNVPRICISHVPTPTPFATCRQAFSNWDNDTLSTILQSFNNMLRQRLHQHSRHFSGANAGHRRWFSVGLTHRQDLSAGAKAREESILGALGLSTTDVNEGVWDGVAWGGSGEVVQSVNPTTGQPMASIRMVPQHALIRPYTRV